MRDQHQNEVKWVRILILSETTVVFQLSILIYHPRAPPEKLRKKSNRIPRSKKRRKIKSSRVLVLLRTVEGQML